MVEGMAEELGLGTRTWTPDRGSELIEIIADLI
jgi:hypothetical protein